MQNKIQKRGFTLVELVVVLVILAILIAVALPTFMGARQRAYRAEALQLLSEVKALAWGERLETGNFSGITDLTSLGYASTTALNTNTWNFSLTPTTTSAPTGLDCTTPCLEVVASGSGGGPVPMATTVTLTLDINGSTYIE